MTALRDLFSALWSDYVAIAPQVSKIHALLSERGERVVNDHVALRTFAIDGIDIEDLDRVFVAGGYQPVQSYEFEVKKLDACHYEHPQPGMPKVFLSALRVGELSSNAQEAIRALVGDLRPGASAEPLFAVSGRGWPLDIATHEMLRAESEYAAWVAAFGFRANHFTVSVNELKSFENLEVLNEFLVANEFALNTSGGTIKGSPGEFLEQSSTLADVVEVELDDGKIQIPSCYYEFARRYPLASGELFSGFVTQSADKIFESTNRGD